MRTYNPNAGQGLLSRLPNRKNETIRAQNCVQPTEEIWQTIKNALTPPAVARREKEAITAAPIAKGPARRPRLPASAAMLAARVRSRRRQRVPRLIKQPDAQHHVSVLLDYDERLRRVFRSGR